MPKGSNNWTKRQVQASAVCYVCEKAPPTLSDDIGGPICQDYHTHMQTQLLKHILKQGYRVRKT